MVVPRRAHPMAPEEAPRCSWARAKARRGRPLTDRTTRPGARRAPTASSTGASDRTSWPFVGSQRGRQITPDRLGVGLGAYGFDARAARTSRMLDLEFELGPSFLADRLGMHSSSAVRWLRPANGDWSGYAAARARP